MKLTKMAVNLCDSSDYCKEMICDYVKKNAGNICDKTLIKLAENLCDTYDYENEIRVFAQYFFNMGLIIVILIYFFADTHRTNQHHTRIQNCCDRIDEIFQEFEQDYISIGNSTNQNVSDKRKETNDEIKRRFFNKLQESENISIFKEAWKCEFNNVLKQIPYWANIFKLRRTQHKPELCQTNWKLVYDTILKEILDRYQVNKFNRYQEFIKNFKCENTDSDFIKVQKPGWGWFGF